jgi:undecaprenyl diphosphate synthase
MDSLTQIDLTKIPTHIAIIMDGNGRWAKKQGQERLFGHSIGVESVRGTLKAAKKMGVKYLTLYTFSTENWNRPQEEIDGLMNLLVQTISNEVDELNASGVKLLSIGDDAGLPKECQAELQDAKDRTAHNTEIHLVLALNYSARWEINKAVKEISKAVQIGKVDADSISDELISEFLSTKGIPDPELLIRTSGEYRISNFLLWQIAYSELHFTPVLWPDFREDDLYKAVIDFQSRERRFGQVSEQIF